MGCMPLMGCHAEKAGGLESEFQILKKSFKYKD